MLDWGQSRKHATYSKEVPGTDDLANTAKNGLGIIIRFLTSTYVETVEVNSVTCLHFYPPETYVLRC